MKKFKKSIFISGGTLGIGKATVKMLVEKGYQVFFCGRDMKRVVEAEQETGGKGFVCDISNNNDVKDLKKKLNKLITKLDLLVNNAAISFDRKPLDEISVAELNRVFGTNVFGPVILTKELLPLLSTSKEPRIINIGSTASIDGYKFGSVYVSSKFALRGLTKCWQYELSRMNINVSLINPGDVSTAWNSQKRIEEDEDPNKLKSIEVAKAITNIIEMNHNSVVPEQFITPLATFANNDPFYK